MKTRKSVMFGALLVAVCTFGHAQSETNSNTAKAPQLDQSAEQKKLQDGIAAYESKNYTAALAILRPLANQGILRAQAILGHMYIGGKGVQKDVKEAVVWYSRAANQGDANVAMSLALRYENGDGVPKDFKQAIFWYTKGADLGFGPAQVNLGLMYEHGRGVSPDLAQAAVLYRKAAEQGLDLAQRFLGNMYSRGRGVPQDDRLAAKWYEKAAEQGDDVSQNNLAVLYDKGQGVEKNDEMAVFWYQKAAEQGLPEAQFTLGSRYFDGRGIAKNEREGVLWWVKAAEQGEAEAQFNVGYAYTNGRGVSKDKQLAFQWYKKAADQGFLDAMFEVGAHYQNGIGVVKDFQLAMAWYRKAAEQGLASAQLNLGAMYDAGEGTPRDYQSGYFWLLLASSQGEARGAFEAGLNRERVEKLLTPEQRATAQTAARNWKKKTAAQANAIASNDSRVESASPGSSPNTPSSSQAEATGSGFRVAKGIVITNHHVIDGCSRLRVNGMAASVRGSDSRSDLAVLAVSLNGPSAAIRAQRVSVGEPLSVSGYPLRGLLSGFNMTTGNLSSLSGMGGDTRLVQITAPVQPGNSGGPVLDSAGNLMGVVVSKLDAVKAIKITGDIPQNVNFAINANVLRSFLDANSVEYETASSDKTLPTTVIADRAKGFTVLVECWK